MPSSAARRARREAVANGQPPPGPAPDLRGQGAESQPAKKPADGEPKKKRKRENKRSGKAEEEAPADDDGSNGGAATAAARRTEWEEEEDAAAEGGGASSSSRGSRPMPERISCTLFVGQLPYSATAADIQKHFRQGGVAGGLKVRLRTHSDGGRSRGTAFVELSSESDVHTALRLHRSPMDGRRINVERTVGGGGNTAARKEKLGELREKQGSQMRKQVVEMCNSILPPRAKSGDADDGGGGGEDVDEDEDEEDAINSGYGRKATAPVCREDVDERVLEFLETVPSTLAEDALREAKALDMGGIRNRPAYLMGVLKRKVAEADKLKQEMEQRRRARAKGGDGAVKRPRSNREAPPAAYAGKKTKLD